MSLKDELSQIVGADHFIDAPAELLQYSIDCSFYQPRQPHYVVQPGNNLEIQAIVQLANKTKVPVVPVSSRIHFHGSSIPKQGGIVVDLQRLNHILDIDHRNRNVKIEAGVTWQQLQSQLAEDQGMVVGPLLPAANQSVITSILEREVPVIQIYEYREPLLSMEVIWPTGELFRTGSASTIGYPDTLVKGACPVGPGSVDFYRLLEGAQGTMGIVTWALLKYEYRPHLNKLFCIPLTSPAQAVEPLVQLGRLKVGYEHLLVNRSCLISMLSRLPEYTPIDLQQCLPPWTLLLVLSGSRARPAERIAYEQEALTGLWQTHFSDLDLRGNIAGVPGVEFDLVNWLRSPWPEQLPFWQHSLRGGCESMPLITKISEAPALIEQAQAILARNGCSVEQLGIYVQPLENCRACHLDFFFYYNPLDAHDLAATRQLYQEVAACLLTAGALFTRPYGLLAPQVYERAGSYTAALKKLKSVFDPNGIMSPGNLCF